MARIAFVSREVYPLRPGGIGQFVTAAATLLADELDVLILTTAMCEDDYRSLRDAGDERLPPVPIEFVAEPTWPSCNRTSRSCTPTAPAPTRVYASSTPMAGPR